MHYSTYVLIPPTGDVRAAVEKALAPFDENLDLPPYKEYLSADEIRVMAKEFGLRPTNLAALASRMEEWADHIGGVDHEGLFKICTHNPDGHWDWWVIGGRFDGIITGGQRRGDPFDDRCEENTVAVARLLSGNRLRKSLPYCLLAPEGDWFVRETVELGAERTDDEAWYQQVKKVLSDHHDCRVVCVDIHR